MFAGQGVSHQCQSRMNCRLYSIVLVQSYAIVFLPAIVLVMQCDTHAAIQHARVIGSEARASGTIELHALFSHINTITKEEMPENQVYRLFVERSVGTEGCSIFYFFSHLWTGETELENYYELRITPWKLFNFSVAVLPKYR